MPAMWLATVRESFSSRINGTYPTSRSTVMAFARYRDRRNNLLKGILDLKVHDIAAVSWSVNQVSSGDKANLNRRERSAPCEVHVVVPPHFQLEALFNTSKNVYHFALLYRPAAGLWHEDCPMCLERRALKHQQVDRPILLRCCLPRRAWPATCPFRTAGGIFAGAFLLAAAEEAHVRIEMV